MSGVQDFKSLAIRDDRRITTKVRRGVSCQVLRRAHEPMRQENAPTPPQSFRKTNVDFKRESLVFIPGGIKTKNLNFRADISSGPPFPLSPWDFYGRKCIGGVVGNWFFDRITRIISLSSAEGWENCGEIQFCRGFSVKVDQRVRCIQYAHFSPLCLLRNLTQV